MFVTEMCVLYHNSFQRITLEKGACEGKVSSARGIKLLAKTITITRPSQGALFQGASRKFHTGWTRLPLPLKIEDQRTNCLGKDYPDAQFGEIESNTRRQGIICDQYIYYR